MNLSPQMQPDNSDPDTVASFGKEWARFDQSDLDADEQLRMFNAYFAIFPWDKLPANAEGFDMGCGSGRWAKYVAPRVGTLHCIDPAAEAVEVAKENLTAFNNVRYEVATADSAALSPESQDFGYLVGVLHYVPDAESAMRACTRLLKPGAPFLVYMYYRFENRPAWFRMLWNLADYMRRGISQLPGSAKNMVTDSIAGLIYWPFARLSYLGEKLGFSMHNMPLYNYRNKSFYTMRTDSLNRFGTPFEQRFSKAEVQEMMTRCGLTDITFSDKEPFWCATGIKVAASQ